MLHLGIILSGRLSVVDVTPADAIAPILNTMLSIVSNATSFLILRR